jgi:hypothetical protein
MRSLQYFSSNLGSLQNPTESTQTRYIDSTVIIDAKFLSCTFQTHLGLLYENVQKKSLSYFCQKKKTSSQDHHYEVCEDQKNDFYYLHHHTDCTKFASMQDQSYWYRSGRRFQKMSLLTSREQFCYARFAQDTS